MKKVQSLECSWRGHLAQTLVSKGSAKKSPMGILVVAVTQTALVVESWSHWMKDFPQWRDSVDAWILSYRPLLASWEQERETLNEQRKNVRWASTHNEGDIYSPGGVVPLQ
jgi:hypothetical protein